MKISVVTISFNQKSYIDRCINSILEQNDDNYEHIIVDANSTDGTKSILLKYPSVITIIEEDAGPADGLRKGFKKAEGEILLFINSDDYLLPNAFEEIRKQFSAKEVEIVFFSGLIAKYNKVVKAKNKAINYKEMLYRVSSIFQPGIVFTREIYNKSGGFNISNRTCWDYELFLNIMKLRPKYSIVDTPIAVFSIHSESITGSGKQKEQYLKQLDKIFFSHTNRKWNWKEKLFANLLRLKKYWKITHDNIS